MQEVSSPIIARSPLTLSAAPIGWLHTDGCWLTGRFIMQFAVTLAWFLRTIHASNSLRSPALSAMLLKSRIQTATGLRALCIVVVDGSLSVSTACSAVVPTIKGVGALGQL